MPTISACPRCSGIVTIPERLAATAWVRCPLCNAEYPLRQALNSIPPVLIPVESPTPEVANRSATEEIPQADEERLSETAVAAELRPVGEIMKPPEGARQTSSAAASSIAPAFPFEFSAIATDNEVSPPDFAGEETTPATESHLDAEMFAGFIKQPDRTPQKSSDQPESAFPRRRGQRKPKHAIRVFIEIVLGGVVGLSIAYIALAWIMGPRFDLPRPPKALRPVLRFVLPDRIWAEKDQLRK
jgi:hypothetical protein